MSTGRRQGLSFSTIAVTGVEQNGKIHVDGQRRLVVVGSRRTEHCEAEDVADLGRGSLEIKDLVIRSSDISSIYTTSTTSSIRGNNTGGRRVFCACRARLAEDCRCPTILTRISGCTHFNAFESELQLTSR